jgi:hypothetical protein
MTEFRKVKRHDPKVCKRFCQGLCKRFKLKQVNQLSIVRDNKIRKLLPGLNSEE